MSWALNINHVVKSKFAQLWKPFVAYVAGMLCHHSINTTVVIDPTLSLPWSLLCMLLFCLRYVILSIVFPVPPDSPSKPSISLSEIHARTVPINWQPGFDGYGPLRNYTIQFQSGNGNWQTVQETVSPELTAYTVTG